MQSSDYPMISVTKGASGHFAVMYSWNPEGFHEPQETGFGRYDSEYEAIQEAKSWASAEEIRLDPVVLDRETALKQLLAADRRNSPFDLVAGQTDPMEDIP